jgi:hypothetical protein
MRRMAKGCIAGLAMLALIAPGLAQDEEEEIELDPATLDCHAEAIEGSGPSFLSARKDSEQAALDDWLEKAKAVFPDADWKYALDSGLACVVQGLYSKCFALGTPCKPKG